MRKSVLGFLALGWVAGAVAGPDLASADVHLVPAERGGLSDLTVVFSPGHGIQPSGKSWRFQRGIVHDLREDIHTNEIFIEYIQRYLINAGARVESCRERSFQIHEVIVDNADSGYAESGTWRASSATAPFVGSGYRWAGVSPSETASARFQPDIPEAGRYPVYVWFSTGSNRSTEAVFVVHHSGGTSRVQVDQSEVGNSWLFLGDFHFEAGISGSVALSNQGSDPSKVVVADAVRFGGGIGDSGLPRWREAAKAFLPHKGFTSSAGDVTYRPRYATWLAGGDTTRWRDDFLYFSLHTNASGSGSSSTATGVSTFAYSNGRQPSWASSGPAHYPTNPSSLQDESDALRDSVHHEVLTTVRATHEPGWRDRRVHRMNFGEVREARNMPSTIIELGFHDSASDTRLLKDARFRATAARAIYKGILRYRNPGADVVPLPVEGLSLVNLGGGQVRVTWEPVLDPIEPSAAPIRFKVYTSSNGRGFDDGTSVPGTSAVISGLSAGAPLFVRVAALNAGGESLPSGVAGAVVGDPGVRRALLVDGFDRSFQHTEANINARWTNDYAVEHIDALAAALPATAVDFAVNEAVITGAVALDGYALVDWFLGREGEADQTFDSAEQDLVERYLTSGGRLVASGTEIAWDLEARSGGRRFLNDVLSVRYRADDSGTRVLRGLPSGPFANVGTVVLDDGTHGCYDAAWPDALSAGPGSSAVMAWETSSAPAAVVASPQVVVMGFPLETVIDDAVRRNLARAAADHLLAGSPAPGQGAGTPSGGSASGSSTPTVGSAPVSQSSRRRRSGSGGCSVTGDLPGAPSSLWPLVVLVTLLLGARRRLTLGSVSGRTTPERCLAPR